MEKLSQGLKWLGRKIWLLLRIFGLLVLAVLPNLILKEPKSQTALVMAGLVTLGLLVFFWWRAEKNDLPVWDPNILTWDGLAIVILAFAIMQLIVRVTGICWYDCFKPAFRSPSWTDRSCLLADLWGRWPHLLYPLS